VTDADAICELIDSIVCLDIGGRGVAGLYAPARARCASPLCEAVACMLTGLEPGDHVFIVTGSLSRANVSPAIAENDGPMGAAVLARALSVGFNAIPVVLADAPILDKVAAMVALAGCNVVSAEEAAVAARSPRFTAVATMASAPAEDAAAQAECERLVTALQPKAVISVERAGLTADGTYRNALGQDYSEGRARLDYVVKEAQDRKIPTVGIGDGGNEIGMGAVREAVREHIPHGKVLCAELATDVLMPVGVSNWGCYAIAAALSVLTGREELAHSPELERRMIGASPGIGLIDGMSGRLDATVDGMPPAVHVGVVELLAQAVRRGCG
jgi:hypothetical protein